MAVCQGLLTLTVLLGWWDLNDQQLASAMGVIALIGTLILAVTVCTGRWLGDLA